MFLDREVPGPMPDVWSGDPAGRAHRRRRRAPMASRRVHLGVGAPAGEPARASGTTAARARAPASCVGPRPPRLALREDRQKALNP